MIYYIAGPITNTPDYKERFAKAEEYLKDQNNIVINPTKILPVGLPHKAYLPICMALIDACDCVYMLEGWEKSKGASAEYHYAVAQKKGVYL